MQRWLQHLRSRPRLCRNSIDGVKVADCCCTDSKPRVRSAAKFSREGNIGWVRKFHKDRLQLHVQFCASLRCLQLVVAFTVATQLSALVPVVLTTAWRDRYTAFLYIAATHPVSTLHASALILRAALSPSPFISWCKRPPLFEFAPTMRQYVLACGVVKSGDSCDARNILPLSYLFGLHASNIEVQMVYFILSREQWWMHCWRK